MNFMPIDASSLLIFQLGANAILAVSLAVCKAGAMVKKIPLYQVGGFEDHCYCPCKF